MILHPLSNQAPFRGGLRKSNKLEDEEISVVKRLATNERTATSGLKGATGDYLRNFFERRKTKVYAGRHLLQQLF